MRSMQWSLRSRLLIALTLAAIVAATTVAQERGAKPPVPAPATNPNAVGLVAFHPTEGMTTSRIRYEAGARTNWHTHTAPQMLWVEDGRGLWQERGDPVKEMVKDVPVVTKANVTHWHGAPANSHSVQLTVYGGTITWGAPVTDAEYQGKK
jgi:quercetin dioxygenase-like cupin family protein